MDRFSFFRAGLRLRVWVEVRVRSLVAGRLTSVEDRRCVVPTLCSGVFFFGAVFFGCDPVFFVWEAVFPVEALRLPAAALVFVPLRVTDVPDFMLCVRRVLSFSFVSMISSCQRRISSSKISQIRSVESGTAINRSASVILCRRSFSASSSFSCVYSA